MTTLDLLQFKLKIFNNTYHTSYFFKLNAGQKYILYKNTDIVLSHYGLYNSAVSLPSDPIFKMYDRKFFIENTL